MWFVRMIKWTLKLFLKLLLFPVFIVTTTLTIILNVILHLGSFAAGLGLLVMLYCIISRLWLHEWSQAVLATGMTAVGIASSSGQVSSFLCSKKPTTGWEDLSGTHKQSARASTGNSRCSFTFSRKGWDGYGCSQTYSPACK